MMRPSRTQRLPLASGPQSRRPLSETQQQQLQVALDADSDLRQAYLLKEEFRFIFERIHDQRPRPTLSRCLDAQGPVRQQQATCSTLSKPCATGSNRFSTISTNASPMALSKA